MVERLGAMLAAMRQLRGKSQAELGIEVGVSPDYISKIERGTRDGFTVGLLLAMADALDARVALVGKSEDDVKEQDSGLILPMRRLLLPVTHVGSSVDEAELTFAKLRKRIMDGTADFNRGHYVKLAADLPALVSSIEAAIGMAEGEAKDNLNRQLAHAYILAAQTLILLRSEDLATHAIRNAMDAAENAGDPVLRASAGENYAYAFAEQGMFSDAEAVAVNLATELGEPSIMKAAPGHLAVWGKLLRMASRAAARDNRPDVADELLSAAYSASVRIDGGRMDYGKYWSILNPAMIGITKAENALVRGDGLLALRISDEIRQTEDLHLDLWAWHLLIRANAQTSTRDYGGAIKTMKSIRRLASEWIKNDRFAHDVVIELLGKVSSRRGRSSGLAELATFMGVQP
jgi:transcriptional regulator with XRE-family HTH domain